MLWGFSMWKHLNLSFPGDHLRKILNLIWLFLAMPVVGLLDFSCQL